MYLAQFISGIIGLFLSMLFSSLEIAFFSLSHEKLNNKIHYGKKRERKRASRILHLVTEERKDRVMVIIIYGNAIANTLLAFALNNMIKNPYLAFSVSSVLLSYVGDLVPKIIATKRNFLIASMASLPMHFIVVRLSFIPWILLFPVAWLLRRVSTEVDAIKPDLQYLLKKFDIKNHAKEFMQKFVNAEQHLTIESCMINIDDAVTLRLNQEITERTCANMLRSNYSHVPVRNNTDGNILGIVPIPALFSRVDLRVSSDMIITDGFTWIDASFTPSDGLIVLLPAIEEKGIDFAIVTNGEKNRAIGLTNTQQILLAIHQQKDVVIVSDQEATQTKLEFATV